MESSLAKKRAAVPGTAALGGCCYFNPPEGQRAQPGDLLRTPLHDSLQFAILNGDVCSSFLALLSFFDFFAGFAKFFT